MKTILSLFDATGTWSAPYREAGYQVIQTDIQLGSDIYDLDPDVLPEIHGVLAAPPCTHFSGSGAQYWKAKDADGRTLEAVELIERTIEIIEAVSPVWWALENPVGRLPSLFPADLGKAKLIFNPCDYGDAYTKKTCLWGTFNPDLPKTPVEPVMYTTKTGKRGSVFWAKLGGNSAKTKFLRSITPPGFAKAFFNANP